MSSEPEEIGVVTTLYRFPVKSMRGEQVDEVELRWHGITGDRRFAFARSDDLSDFPWLTGRQVPDMLRCVPHFTDPSSPKTSPVVVTMPDGASLPIQSDALLARMAESYGGPVHLVQANRGTFDGQGLSFVTNSTLRAIQEHVDAPLDAGRFRINIVIELHRDEPFAEDGWGERLLLLGDRPDSARARVTARIARCVMVNIDPQTARKDHRVLRAVVQHRENYLGVYASTERPGYIRTGDVVRLTPAR